MSIHNSNIAEDVKVMMLKGEKGDTGYPTDAQVQTAVDDWLDESGGQLITPWMNTHGADAIETSVDSWLDDHPEATTTVQDGAITEAKLDNALKLKIAKEYVTPQMFGAVGNGVADDTTAMQQALSNPVVFIPSGTYKITNTLTASANFVIGQDCEIVADFAECKSAVMKFTADDVINVSGISIDANNIAAICFLIDDNDNDNVLDEVNFENCIGKNTDNADLAVTVGGLIVDRQSKITSIERCNFTEICRSSGNAGVIASNGIGVGQIVGVCNISNNYIDGVYFDESIKSDADGIRAFSLNRLDASLEEDTNINIENNVILNCQGRFVKVQGENFTISKNTCKNNNIELMSEFRGIDLQTGKGMILNNIIHLVDCTGGSSRAALCLAARNYTKRYVHAVIEGNDIFNSALSGYGLLYGCLDIPASIKFNGNILRNFINGVYVSRSVELTNPTDLIVCANSFFNVTNTVKVVTESSYISKIVENNIGAVSTVTSTGADAKAVMMDIYNAFPQVGDYQGYVDWTSHGGWAYRMTRISATRAIVMFFEGAYIYLMYHGSDSQIVYYQYKFTTQLS